MKHYLLFLSLLLLFLVGCGPGMKARSFIKFNPFAGGTGDKKEMKPPPDSSLGTILTYDALKRLEIMVPIAFLTLVLGGVVFAMGHNMGLKIAACGFIALMSYFALVQYMKWIALLGFLGCMGLVAWIVVVRMRGWKETVRGMDKVLEAFPEQRDKMLEVMGDHQTLVTEDLVKGIKAKVQKEEKVLRKKNGKGFMAGPPQYKIVNDSEIQWPENDKRPTTGFGE